MFHVFYIKILIFNVLCFFSINFLYSHDLKGASMSSGDTVIVDKPAKILLVEDNPDDVTLFRRAFDKVLFNYSFSHASDGEKALEIINNSFKDNPDIILLDLNMPVMDGFEFLKNLKGIDAAKHIPVVVMTTSHDDEVLRKAYEHGANTVIEKSNFYESLNDVIKLMIDYWYNLAHIPKT